MKGEAFKIDRQILQILPVFIHVHLSPSTSPTDGVQESGCEGDRSRASIWLRLSIPYAQPGTGVQTKHWMEYGKTKTVISTIGRSPCLSLSLCHVPPLRGFQINYRFPLASRIPPVQHTTPSMLKKLHEPPSTVLG